MEGSSLPPPNAAAGIPLFEPEIDGNAWNYVKECLDTAWVSSAGPFVDRFEQMLAAAAEVRFAVAVSSGTAALHTALLLAGVQPEDEVLVSTLTFIASSNAVRYCGAWPVFIDAEPRHWQIDANLVEEFLRRSCVGRDGALWNVATGRRVSAIVPVHVLGHPVDMDPLLELARRYGLKLVEDAAEGLGVKYKGRPVGGLGDVGCLSFNGNKLITTGGGGAILTNDAQLAARARYLTTQAKDDSLNYVHGEVGYNYRLTNLQAALGCAQLESLPEFIARKRQAAGAYRGELAGIPGVATFESADHAFCTFWMNTIRISAEEYGCDSRQLMRDLAAGHIQTRPLWQPMHRSPAHRGCATLLSGVADRLHDECLSLPSSVGLRPEQITAVCRAICDRGAVHAGRRAA